MLKKKIDRSKYDYLRNHFLGVLKNVCGVDNLRKWDKKQVISMQQRTYDKLGEALERITNGKVRDASYLLSDRDPPISLEEFKSLLGPFEGKRPDEKLVVTGSRDSSKSGKSSPTNAAGREEDTPPFEKYRNGWLDTFRCLLQPANAFDSEHRLAIERRTRKLEKFRFDRFICPAIEWRRGMPPMLQRRGENDENWTKVDKGGEWDPTATFLLEQLRTNPLLIMYDDAGMGKSAFTWMLFHSILCSDSQKAFVVRIEGHWPTKISPKGKSAGFATLREILVEELLAYRENGISLLSEPLEDDERRREMRRKAENELDVFAKDRSVYIFLDGLDQMPPVERKAALSALRQSLDGRDGLGNCHWLVSGRPYAFRIADQSTNKSPTIFDEQCPRFRLKKFDHLRQRKYFEDLEQDPFFREKSMAPLDYVCAGWKDEATAEDLGIPLHLSEIRRVIEFAKGPSGDAPIQEDGLSKVHSSSDLHARVSDVYLQRAIQTTTISTSTGPSEPREKIQALRRICSVLAMQMMLDGNYNASINATTGKLASYRGVRREQLVATYLERCQKRYMQSLQGEPSYWDWGVELLQQIEVTHRGDIDVFQDECRSFRDTKAMEWYAAFYLANYSTKADWEDAIPDAGQTRINDFLGYYAWTRCWQLAMELPGGYCEDIYLEHAIERVLATPDRKVARSQKCEWMWIAWQSRLEQDGEAKRRNIPPLHRATTVIENFRKQFRELVIRGDQVAITLHFDAERDAPDFTLENPNQTEEGWYRRIPDDGEFSLFRGARTETVTVPLFWLRKFVVTRKEYRLFDPQYGVDQTVFEDLELPATNIDWFSATMFCRWLGPCYRLPTKEEGESACRANRVIDGELHEETNYWFGNELIEATKHMWCKENSDDRPHSLAESLRAGGHENRWGLFDMLGNVWEWCSDEVGPLGSFIVDYSTHSLRVLRGSGYVNPSEGCRSALRNGLSPDDRSRDLGFRLALEFPVRTEKAEP